MCFSSLTRAVDRTAAMCSLQTQAGAPAGQSAQSAVQRSSPSVTHIMGYYSFNRPRRDGRLSWPCWLTDSGRRTHKVIKQPSISLAQDRESLPARTDVLTTMLRHQLNTVRVVSTIIIKNECTHASSAGGVWDNLTCQWCKIFGNNFDCHQHSWVPCLNSSNTSYLSKLIRMFLSCFHIFCLNVLGWSPSGWFASWL